MYEAIDPSYPPERAKEKVYDKDARIEQLTKTCESLGRKLKDAESTDANQRLLVAAETFRRTVTRRNKTIAKAERTIFRQREQLAKMQAELDTLHHKMSKEVAEKVMKKAESRLTSNEWLQLKAIIDSLTEEEK